MCLSRNRGDLAQLQDTEDKADKAARRKEKRHKKRRRSRANRTAAATEARLSKLRAVDRRSVKHKKRMDAHEKSLLDLKHRLGEIKDAGVVRLLLVFILVQVACVPRSQAKMPEAGKNGCLAPNRN